MNGYDIIYNWFDVLKSNGHLINGFVPIAIGMSNPAYRQAGTFMRLSVSQKPRSQLIPSLEMAKGLWPMK